MLVIGANYIYLGVYNSLYSSKPALVNEMLFWYGILTANVLKRKKVNYG